MNEKDIKILLVEDNPGDARLLKEALFETGSSQFHLTHVASMEECLQKLSVDRFDVILLDLSLPDAHGTSTVSTVHAVAADIPIMVLTGLDDEAIAVEALREGAQDYLVRGQVEGDLLVRSIRYSIERKQSETAIKRRLEFEKAVSAISSRFVGIADIDDAIKQSIADMAVLCEAERAHLILLRRNSGFMDVIHEYCADGVSPQKDQLQNIKCSEFLWWWSKLSNGEIINIADISEIPSEAKGGIKVFEYLNMRSVLAFPVTIGGKLTGFIGMQNPSDKREWVDDDFALLRLSAEIIGNALERKSSEETLRFTQFSIDHAAEAIFWINPDARIIYVNGAACESLGYSREELLTMTVHNFDPNFTADIWSGHWQELRKRHSFMIESFHRTKDGNTFPVEVTVNYLKFEGREYNCAFAHNITERKLTEKEIQKHTRELEMAKEAAEKNAEELRKAFEELNRTKQDMERFNKAAVGREMRIIEVKHEVNELLLELRREPKYKTTQEHSKI